MPDGDQEFTYFTDQDELVLDLIASTAAHAIKYVQFVKEARNIEARAVAETFVLALQAFAHRARGVLSLTTHLFAKNEQLIYSLADERTSINGKERQDIYQLLRETESSITVLTGLYSQYQRWFGGGDRRESVAIVEVIDAALKEASAERAGVRKKVRVDKHIEEALPPAHIRRSIVTYVLHELLRNATRQKASRVSLVARSGKRGFIDVIVADDGPGLGKRAAEAFRRGDRVAGQRSTEGGLGLLLSRRFIELEEGHLSLWDTVPSEIGLHGACFVMSLPTQQVGGAK